MGGICLPVPYPKSYWMSIADDKDRHYSLGAYNAQGRLIGAVGVMRCVKDYLVLKYLHHDERELINLFRKVCYITTLIVSPDFRKIGVATQLLQRASTVLLQEGSQLIYLHVLHSNLPAIRLYEKLGYKKVVEIPNYYKIDDKDETGIIYCRRLGTPTCHQCLAAPSCSIL
ncbi:hypothetical protein KIN20_019082 [Parelaphostrongylus tenuis]|uniref:N-alpha-acetyltransferase 60 n=1 Tax=Parelaphostrongylus tenuis TaxID=148309 RepID=A0AAD5MR03_PARTN|nr:hypothetical protein KIN20_019082 [Parelaphostrongylus tenuis]